MDEQKIIMMRLDALVPYKNNPRVNDAAVPAVKASISEFGFKVPIIVDVANTIIAGHTRYKAAMELGLEEVPVIQASSLSSEQVQAFRVIDNKTQELAKWDYAKLDEELDKIMNIDMSLFGFTDIGGEDGTVREQNLDDSSEISLDDFEDENFECECPVCGFRFNDKKGGTE